MEIPTLSPDEEIEYVVIDSYELLKLNIYEAEFKHIVILTEKVILGMTFKPPMPSTVIVEETIPTIEGVDKAIIVGCNEKTECFDALLNIVYDKYHNDIIVLETWIMCPCLKTNRIHIARTNEEGEIINERVVMV